MLIHITGAGTTPIVGGVLAAFDSAMQRARSLPGGSPARECGIGLRPSRLMHFDSVGLVRCWASLCIVLVLPDTSYQPLQKVVRRTSSNRSHKMQSALTGAYFSQSVAAAWLMILALACVTRWTQAGLRHCWVTRP